MTATVSAHLTTIATCPIGSGGDSHQWKNLKYSTWLPNYFVWNVKKSSVEDNIKVKSRHHHHEEGRDLNVEDPHLVAKGSSDDLEAAGGLPPWDVDAS